MSKKMTVEREEITPEKAQKYLEKLHLMRNPSPKLVAHFARDIRDGNWVENGATMVLGPDGELIDGMHRLMAVVEAGKSIYANVVRLSSLADAKAVLDDLRDIDEKKLG